MNSFGIILLEQLKNRNYSSVTHKNNIALELHQVENTLIYLKAYLKLFDNDVNKKSFYFLIPKILKCHSGHRLIILITC